MPVKLIQNLRLLNPSLPITRFSLMKSLKSTRVGPIFSRVFHHDLKFQSLSKNNLGFPNVTTKMEPLLGTARNYSTRRLGSDVKASKSLIEDEAELSDWVSELRSDSFKNSKLYSDSEDNGDVRGGMRNRENLGRRRRESDFDNYGGDSGRGRGGYSSSRRGDLFSRDSSRGKGRSGGEFEGRRVNGSRGGGRESYSSDYGMSSRGRGGLSSRGRGGLRNGGRGSRDSDDYGRENYSSDFGMSSRGRGGLRNGGRGSRDSDTDDYGRGGLSNRGRGRGRGGRDSFESGDSRGKGRFGGEGRNEGFMSRRNENNSRGGRNSIRGSRGGRGSEFGAGRDRSGGRDGGLATSGNGFKRGRLMMSDTDDVDDDDDEDEEDEDVGVGKVRDSFRELISEEDSEEDSEDVDDEEEEAAEDDDGHEAFKSASSFSKSETRDGPVVSPTSSLGGNDSYLSGTRFDQCSVSSLSLKAVKDAGYEKMTVVQEATLPVILKGKDVLAKARTGTGKTVAFLLPSIEVVSKLPPGDRDQRRPPIIVLVICPTRELASQAAAEANKLLKYHSSIGVQVVIGGTRLALEQKRMQANPCQILVATPGRLKDHIENTAGFATRLMGVKVLVLDEADHLLDMGFRKDIEKIIAAVPKQRQTLLFSATVPQEVRQICHIALKRDHEYINTVEEGSEETHAQVRQTHLVAPLEKHFPILSVLLKEHITDDVDYKVLVFCTTAMVTRLVADLLGELNLNVREIHSRKPQSYRTRVSDEFRKSKGLILVTSDVSARGVDYPDVTLVIQVGLPSGKEQYIHRLGRTGRRGKEGQGILLLAPWEEFFLSTLRDLPITKGSSPSVDPDTKKKVEKALSNVEMKNKEAAYQAWLGYYNSNKTVGKDKYRLVELANDFSRCMGLDNPPAIPKLILGKMGLKNVPGLRSR